MTRLLAHWGSASPMTVSFSPEEEVFFSMADMDMSHSLSSLPPLGDPPHMDLELSLTSTYTNTPAGSPLSATVVTYYSFLLI